MNTNNKIVFYLIILQFFVIVIYGILDLCIESHNAYFLSGIISIAFFAVLLFAISKHNYISLNKQYFRISTIFILGYLIVCYQKYVDLLCGYVNSQNSFLFVSPLYIDKAAILSTAGLLSFIIGYLIYKPTFKKKQRKIRKIISTKVLNYILLAAVCLFIYYNGIDYILGSYSQEYLESRHGSIASYSEIIVRSIIFAILILHTKNGSKTGGFFFYVKSLGVLFYLSLFAYLFLVLISGDRGPLISIASAYLFSYILKMRPKFSLWKIALLLAIASFGITILGVIRDTDNELSYNERINLALNSEKMTTDRSVINSTAELASSVRCLHYAMDYVPSKHPFLHGSFQFRDLFSIIPASNSILNTFMDSSFQYTSSAYFITYINQGKHYKYGDGSNVVADLYLSFGITGVVIGLFIFGLFLKYLEVICFSCNITEISYFIYALAFAYIGFAIYMSRATILMPLKYASFTYIILVIYHYYLKIKHYK